MFDLEDFEEAADRIAPYVSPSPLIRSQWLSKLLDAEVYLKLECLQPGKSFKIRGATNALLSQQTLPKLVITASGGNHGLGVAIAASRLKLACTVVLPKGTSSYRVELLEELGAKVIIHGDAWDEANTYALELAKEHGTLYVHPFADKEVILGQGSIALELIDELGEFDAVIASIGGGGMLGGIALALEAMEREYDIDMFGVETRGADSMAQSLAAGELVTLDAITSIAKTLGAKRTTPFIFESMQRLLSDCWVVDDRDAVEMMVQFLEHEKLLVEPATACILAAALQHKDVLTARRIVFIICGSNVTVAELEGWEKEFLE